MVGTSNLGSWNGHWIEVGGGPLQPHISREQSHLDGVWKPNRDLRKPGLVFTYKKLWKMVIFYGVLVGFNEIEWDLMVVHWCFNGIQWWFNGDSMGFNGDSRGFDGV